MKKIAYLPSICFKYKGLNVNVTFEPDGEGNTVIKSIEVKELKSLSSKYKWILQSVFEALISFEIDENENLLDNLEARLFINDASVKPII